VTRLASKLRSALGAVVREAMLYPNILMGKWRKMPRVMILPSANHIVGSSLLRAYKIGEYLEANGWSVILCHANLRLQQRKRILRLFRPDVILIQKSRHPDNIPQHYLPVPCVFDLDDADFLDPKQHSYIMKCMEGCSHIIAGSRYIADWCRPHNPSVSVIWTGTDIQYGESKPQSARGDVIAWAASSPLDYTNEANFVEDVMRRVAKKRPQTTLYIYGDNGSAAYEALKRGFTDAGVKIRSFPWMDYNAFVHSLDEAAVGLNPLVDMNGYSAGKSFGKVLGYLEAQVPSINSPNVDHPLFFEHGRNGMLASEPQQWADIVDQLLSDSALRQRIADAAKQDMIARLSIPTAGKLVASRLERVIAHPHTGFTSQQ